MANIDDAGQHVLAFHLRVQNVGRIAELTRHLEEMADLGDWRDYTTGLYVQRRHQFDYFLIASGVHFDDARRVIQWAKVGTKLAALMDPTAPTDRRRPIDQAAKTWHSPGAGVGFVDRARELGWVADGRSVKRAVSRRALQEAKAGQTNEEHAERSAQRALRPTGVGHSTLSPTS